MKLERKSGVQIILLQLPGQNNPREFIEHSDIIRKVDWPAASAPANRV
jgi:hypothetical protein